MQINDLIDIIAKLENLYKTDKDYILKYLKILSNNNKFVNIKENEIVKFCFVFLDYELFHNNFINCVEHDDIFDDKNVLSSYVSPIGSMVELRDIFGKTNLCDVMRIIECIISHKDQISKINEKSIDNLYRYIDCLINNLQVISVYFYDEIDDEVGIDPSDVITFDIEKNFDFDIDEELKILESSSDYIVEYSEEATTTFEERQNEKAKDYVAFLRNIGKSIVKLNSIMNKNILTIKNFYQKMNVPRSIFYKKNIGRIDHLFKNYANDAMIKENEVKRDPVVILDTVVPEYMNNVINGILKVYNDYNKHIDSLFLSSSLQDMVVKINRYLTYPESKLNLDANVAKINTSLKLDLRYKIAQIILADNEVYGYTVDSIVLNKYPPLNHLIVSLFLNRPHEYPKEQSVADVFEMADSFKILNNKFKDFVTVTATIADRKLASIHMQQDISKISQGIKSYQNNNILKLKSFVSEDIRNKTSEGSDKKDLKQRLSVLKNHEHLLQSFIPIFLYIANAGVVIYNVAVRIDHTARTAIKAMIEIEKERTDATTKYKTGVGTDKKKEIKPSDTAKTKLYKTSRDVALTSRDDTGNKVVYFSGDKKVRKIANQK